FKSDNRFIEPQPGIEFKDLTFSNVVNIVDTFEKKIKHEFLSMLFNTSGGSYEQQNDVDSSLQFHVDVFFDINNQGVFIEGWMDDYNKKINSIFLKSPLSESVNLLPHLSRKRRQDVNKVFQQIPAEYNVGFFCYMEYSRLRLKSRDFSQVEFMIVDEN